MMMIPERLHKSISNQKVRLILVVSFYALMLIPTQYPKFAGTAFFFLYVLTVALSFLILGASVIGVLIIGGIAVVKRKSMTDKQYSFSVLVLTSVIAVVLMIAVAHLLPANCLQAPTCFPLIQKPGSPMMARIWMIA